MENIYTVRVGGTEVNDFYVDLTQAQAIEKHYIQQGYDDVIIEQITGD